MGYVYILTTKNNKMLYIGVTNNLIRRVYEHKQGLVEGFTKKFHIKKLVYYEQFSTIQDAISREKVLKEWNRAWKNHLIDLFNPSWRDLYEEIALSLL
ncbi:MAG: GIY-YIG nuclease family protein [Elusimicrobiaceae bacterium]|nr:GIY-YIG nuclease family protein [Elusimicrobiaceae bacterium]